MNRVPEIRIQALNSAPVNEKGEFVLYWMIASRRTRWNFGLDRAVEWAEELNKPLVILEPLRCDYPWASHRLHRFILQGMNDNLESLRESQVLYYPYVERGRREGKGLLEALSSYCSVVVTDDFPGFFLPKMTRAAARKVSVLLETVDSNGILPLKAAGRAFTTAYSFRRFLQKELPGHLSQRPKEEPLDDFSLKRLKKIPEEVSRKRPPAHSDTFRDKSRVIESLPIDRTVRPSKMRGGSAAANQRLRSFIRERLKGYSELRNHPDEDATSGLSPYLHFGHISAHQVFFEIARSQGWSLKDTSLEAKGQREGWWGMKPSSEAFLDQLITWRELGFNMCSKRDDYDRFESLPGWAYESLMEHADDPRPYTYSLEEFEAASTHDPLWNAAQRQLTAEGIVHNYLRMLWGKKILHWSSSPLEALDIMVELNNRYALDGRDPNSYSGIFWVLGRYDRAWGPQRPVFGKVRYMSSKNTLRKVRVKEYLGRYGPK